MRKIIILSLVVMLFVIGCARDLPPEPGAPGAPIGKATGVFAGYAPTIDVFNEEKIFSLEVAQEDKIVMIKADVNHVGGYVYKYGYINTKDGWKKYEFPQDTVGRSNWIRKSANMKIQKDVDDLNEGDNYILGFSCKKYKGAWKCGCREENDCGYWMIHVFQVEKKPDLTVSSISFEEVVLNNKLGIQAYVTIENIGNKEALSPVILPIVNGEKLPYTIFEENLPVGEAFKDTSPELFFDFDTFSGKDVELEFIVDPDNKVAESNEGNNKLSTTQTITENLPDIAPVTPVEENETKCTDTDGGKNYYVKGTAEGLGSSGQRISLEDSCFLRYASGGGANVAQCEAGVNCGLEEVLCFGDTVVIYSPNGSGVDCPNGCKDGACVEGEEIKDTIQEAETKTYTFNNKEYEVKCLIVQDVGETPTKLKVNGEVTPSLKQGQGYILTDSIGIFVKSIFPNEAGDVTGDIVEFILTKKVSCSPGEIEENGVCAEGDATTYLINNIMHEDESKTIVVKYKEYVVKVSAIGDISSSVKVSINGEWVDEMNEGESYVFDDSLRLVVKEVVSNEHGDKGVKDLVEFGITDEDVVCPKGIIQVDGQCKEQDRTTYVVKDIITEGESKTFSVDNQNYIIEALVIEEVGKGVLFKINDGVIDKLKTDEGYVISPELRLVVKEVIAQEAGETLTDVVEFGITKEDINCDKGCKQTSTGCDCSASQVVCDVRDIIQEGETKTYTIGSKAYEVKLVVVTDTGTIYAQLEINGERTDKLVDYEGGNLFTLADSTVLKIINVVPNEAGDATGDVVDFCLKTSEPETPTLLNGTIAYYNFDEGSGSVAKDYMGNHDGTITGAVFAEGVAGNALSFDGTDDYVEIPDSTDFDVVNGFTYEAWIKPTSFRNPNIHNAIIGHLSPYLAVKSDGKLYVYRKTGRRGSRYAAGNTSLELNKWHHVVGTFDRNEGYMKLYLDGKLDAVSPRYSYTREYSYNMYIGKRYSSNTYEFTGLIDEVKIYNRGLSAEEIKQQYQAMPKPVE